MIPKRIEDQIDKSGPCWIWKRNQMRVILDGKRWCVARYIYQAFHGDFDENSFIKQKCENHKCVNPNHLVARARSWFFTQPGILNKNHHAQKTHCRNGHELSGQNIYKLKTHYRVCRICANHNRAIRRRKLKESAYEQKSI